MENISKMIDDLEKIRVEKNRNVADATLDIKRMAEILEYVVKRAILSQQI